MAGQVASPRHSHVKTRATAPDGSQSWREEATTSLGWRIQSDACYSDGSGGADPLVRDTLNGKAGEMASVQGRFGRKRTRRLDCGKAVEECGSNLARWMIRPDWVCQRTCHLHHHHQPFWTAGPGLHLDQHGASQWQRTKRRWQQ